MVLYVIGLGLGDEKDITVRGLEAVRGSAKVVLEHYTSILGVDKAKLVRPRHRIATPRDERLVLTRSQPKRVSVHILALMVVVQAPSSCSSLISHLLSVGEAPNSACVPHAACHVWVEHKSPRVVEQPFGSRVQYFDGPILSFFGASKSIMRSLLPIVYTVSLLSHTLLLCT